MTFNCRFSIPEIYTNKYIRCLYIRCCSTIIKYNLHFVNFSTNLSVLKQAYINKWFQYLTFEVIAIPFSKIILARIKSWSKHLCILNYHNWSETRDIWTREHETIDTHANTLLLPPKVKSPIPIVYINCKWQNGNYFYIQAIKILVTLSIKNMNLKM